MHSIKVSNEATVAIAELANKEGLTIPEATERLIVTGSNRIRALKKWRRKDARARKTARTTSSGSRSRHAT